MKIYRVNKISILVSQQSNDEFFDKINSGKWLEIIDSDEFKKFLTSGVEDFDKDRKLGLAVACLLAFVQENFTGPDLFESPESIRFETFGEQEKWKAERISVDGIEFNANIRNITLLIISRNFLDDLHEQFPEDLVR